MSVLELDLRLPLDRFELRVEAALGEAVALLGPSGAGKSSLVECIAGLRPASGRIVLAGQTQLQRRGEGHRRGEVDRHPRGPEPGAEAGDEGGPVRPGEDGHALTPPRTRRAGRPAPP